jgi:hypothetical protein
VIRSVIHGECMVTLSAYWNLSLGEQPGF